MIYCAADASGSETPLTPRVTNLIAFVQVAEVERSVAFYEKLGFEVTDTYDHRGELDFAAMETGRAQLMLVRAARAIDPREQRILFYLYTPDLMALRDRLGAQGVAAGPIVDGSPGPEREMSLRDPDGYCLMVAEADVA